MNLINFLIKLLNGIAKTLTYLYKYRDIYRLTGVFATRKFRPAKKNHSYAVLIAARNESAVIGNLIESIRAQDYPKELIKIFVVADNCTDNTADIARTLGAECYERTDPDRRTKGYALQYLVSCIDRDYGYESFEGYFIFDADNLLKSDYISRMNDAFDSGEKIITSYRNTKNFGDNWISASYALHWLRTIRNEHRARSLLRLATRIQGTGFLFANELIKNGWNYTSLTEDRAFCADAVVQGYSISYNHDAEFYDEQPVDIKIAMRQRIRWAKGHLQAVKDSGGKLLLHIFKTGKSAGSKALPPVKRFLYSLRLRFMSFDMLTTIFPRSLYTVFKRVAVYFLKLILIIITGKSLMGAVDFAFVTLSWSAESYLRGILTAAYIFIIEHRRIAPIKWYKKLWFCVTFPIFDLIGKLSLVIALFKKVEWKPIHHNAAISISELSARRNKPA